MPWSCSNCEIPFILDDEECPACGAAKANWTVEIGATRVMQVARQRATLEVELLDESGDPVAGADCLIRFANGTERSSNLGEDGLTRFRNLIPGLATVSFPEDDLEEEHELTADFCSGSETERLTFGLGLEVLRAKGNVTVPPEEDREEDADPDEDEQDPWQSLELRRAKEALTLTVDEAAAIARGGYRPAPCTLLYSPQSKHAKLSFEAPRGVVEEPWRRPAAKEEEKTDEKETEPGSQSQSRRPKNEPLLLVHRGSQDAGEKLPEFAGIRVLDISSEAEPGHAENLTVRRTGGLEQTVAVRAIEGFVVELKTEWEGAGVPETEFRLWDQQKKIHSGRLDLRGQAHVYELPDGNLEVAFPDGPDLAVKLLALSAHQALLTNDTERLLELLWGYDAAIWQEAEEEALLREWGGERLGARLYESFDAPTFRLAELGLVPSEGAAHG